jgi:membrane protein YqaA with SNARE-associated domain
MGGFGLFFLGIFDSSFLFLPLGNDLLLVALTARHHERMLYYALMAAAGSLTGVLLTDIVSRKGGEKGLEKRISKGRLAYIQRQVEKRAGVALAIASIMPPPFPFTAFVIVAAALKYPRSKLLTVVGAARLARFLIEGALAVHYGRGILRLAQTSEVQDVVLGIIVISIAGSAWSIYSWARKSG